MTITLDVHHSLTVLRKALGTLQLDMKQLEENPAANFEYLKEKHDSPNYSAPAALHTLLSGRAASIERTISYLTSFQGYLLMENDSFMHFNTISELNTHFEEIEDTSDVGSYDVYPIIAAPFKVDVEREYSKDDVELKSERSMGDVKYDLFWKGTNETTKESRDLEERDLRDEIAELLNDGVSQDDIWVEKKSITDATFYLSGEPVVRVTYTQVGPNDNAN
jgi:hypothetical protein